jgi:hypothetical protein
VVDLSYEDRKPFAFTGTIKKVVFDIKPHLSAHDEQALLEAAHHGHAALAAGNPGLALPWPNRTSPLLRQASTLVFTPWIPGARPRAPPTPFEVS